jgi:outer membrane receptor protein involved in Fe transport
MTARHRARPAAVIDPRRRLEQVTTLTAAVMAAIYGTHARADADEGTLSLQEVVVTATRREVSAQDLPISITAVSGSDLEQAGIEDMSSLAHSMAGVNFTDKGPFSGINGSGLIIRGLNSEGTGGQLGLATPVVPPVATYVDDTPLYFNLRLQDLDRVEILRGPQGTLYGSGSLGGTIRFVQNAPDPSGFDARAEVGVGDTQHTHAPNEEVNGMLNLPLSDTLAVRLNAGWTYDAGFINQPNLYALNSAGAPLAAQPGNVFSPPEIYAKDGTNSYQYHTARISALWKPNDEFHAEVNYYYQLGIANGFPYAATNSAAYNKMLGPGEQGSLAGFCANAASNGVSCSNPAPVAQLYNAPVPGGVDSLSNADNSLEGAHDAVDLISLTLEYDMGFATLTSDTSWAQHLNHSMDDLTTVYANFGFYQSIYGQNPRTFVVGHDELDDRPLTQELRLASKLGGTFDWVGGLFYKNEYENIQEHEFYPGYLNFFNNCSATYGAATSNQFLFEIPSYCGVGETGYTPGVNSSLYGIPIPLDQTYIGDFETRFKDLAAFGELTAHLTQAWSITGGTRVFKQTVSQSQQTGLLFDGGGLFLVPISAGGIGPPPVANSSLSASWSRALWKANTAYQLDPTNLVYATYSQGFRRGGVNALPPAEPAENYVTPAALSKLQPDTADNYEIGVKGTLMSRFRYSADVFDIQWKNIQEGVQLTPLVLPASLNVGDAFSRGFETEFEALWTRHFSTVVNYTYDQTKLTSVNPLDVNESVPEPMIGSALPGTPKNSLAVDFAYGQMELAGGQLRYDIDAHYQSSLIPALSATVPTVGGYTMLNTRLSFAHAHWLTAIYVNNLTNNLGITSYSDPAIYGNRTQAIVSQPRTFGLTVAYSFKEH